MSWWTGRGRWRSENAGAEHAGAEHADVERMSLLSPETRRAIEERNRRLADAEAIKRAEATYINKDGELRQTSAQTLTDLLRQESTDKSEKDGDA